VRFRSHLGMIILIILLSLTTVSSYQLVYAGASEVVVPNDYPSIAEAVENADPGSIVRVKAGIYRDENVLINKSLTLVFEEGVVLRNSMLRVINTSNVVLTGSLVIVYDTRNYNNYYGVGLVFRVSNVRNLSLRDLRITIEEADPENSWRTKYVIDAVNMSHVTLSDVYVNGSYYPMNNLSHTSIVVIRADGYLSDMLIEHSVFEYGFMVLDCRGKGKNIVFRYNNVSNYDTVIYDIESVNISIYENYIRATDTLLSKVVGGLVFIYNNTLVNVSYVYSAFYTRNVFIWYNDLGYSVASIVGGTDYKVYFHSPYPVKYRYKDIVCLGYLGNYYIPAVHNLTKNETSGLLVGSYPMEKREINYYGSYFLAEPRNNYKIIEEYPRASPKVSVDPTFEEAFTLSVRSQSFLRENITLELEGVENIEAIESKDKLTITTVFPPYSFSDWLIGYRVNETGKPATIKIRAYYVDSPDLYTEIEVTLNGTDLLSVKTLHTYPEGIGKCFIEEQSTGPIQGSGEQSPEMQKPSESMETGYTGSSSEHGVPMGMIAVAIAVIVVVAIVVSIVKFKRK